MTDPREDIALRAASLARNRCICLDAEDISSCQCPVPVTRVQAGRLRVFAVLRPDWAVVYSVLAAEWLAARVAFLPQGDDPVAAWLRAPFDVPPEAGLRHAGGLDALLDGMGTPATEDLS
jgi:hypothetical protein